VSDRESPQPHPANLAVRVKIRCIQSVDEARMALEHGAAAIALVRRMPSGPEKIDEAANARIAGCVPPGACHRSPRGQRNRVAGGLWRFRRLGYVVLLAHSASCTSVYRVPPSLESEQRIELEGSPFSQLVLGIEPAPLGEYVPEDFMNDFVALFVRSGLFKEAGCLNALDTQPDLIVTLQSRPPGPYCGTPEACAMIVTLGIVPIKTGDDRKYSFALSNPRQSRSLELEFLYVNSSYFGSISTTLMKISSSWSSTSQGAQNQDLFSYELLVNRDKILALLE
jgi:hypothetical protein